MTPTLDNFIQAMSEAGLTPPPHVLADGKLHRFAGNGRADNDSAWYALHSDGVPAGVFGDWRTGLKQTWCAKSDRQMTSAERDAHRQRIEKIKREREAEDQRRHAEAAAEAQRIWDTATPASDDHPYLQRKHVEAHGLRVDDEGDLVIPVRINGAIRSLQFIDADGKKLFLTGGAKQGGSFTIGDTGDHTVICIAEGYATAASIYGTTGYPVRTALDAGNLLPVARMTRAQYPHATIILCADNDIHADGKPNTGILSARAAAQAIGGRVASPEMDGEKCDFNDVHIQHGLVAVKEAIEMALEEQHSGTMSGLSVPDPEEWPEPSPVSVELLPVECLPLSIVPLPYRAWIKDVSERMQCPP